MSGPDLSEGLEDSAALISILVSGWQEFGYVNPPAPGCKSIPPLGERSATAITAGHDAVDAIDRLIRQLNGLRGQLVGELRKDGDIRAARIDRSLKVAGSVFPKPDAAMEQLRAGRNLPDAEAPL